MTTIHLQFEVAPGGQPQQAAADLQQKLSALPEVSSAKTEALGDVRFSVAEAMAIVTAVITIARHGKEAVENIRALLKALRSLVGELKDLRGCFLELGTKKVAVADVEKMTDAEIEQHL